MHKRTFDQERRASARRGWANARGHGGLTPPALAQSANNDDAQRTFDQERRASARRGWGNAHRQTRALLVGRPPTVCVRLRSRASPLQNRVYRRHGGLTPPALALRCERLPAKQRFLRCTNAHSTKSGGRQPAVAGDGVTHSGSNIGHLRRPLLRTNIVSGIRESTVLQIQPGVNECAGRSRRGHKNLARFSCLRRRLSEPGKIERFRA
jgi:hypothetical protein